MMKSKKILLFFLIAALCFSIFKHISYPLMWADESMTAAMTEHVIQYGYPKVHGEKNVLYDLRHSNPTLGIDKKTDAYIGNANWGMYYFGIIAVKAANMASDVYTKTATARIPFALAGLLGIFLYGFLGAQFSSNKKSFFIPIFLLIEILAIPLTEHIREFRYYPLVLLLSSLSIYLYASYRFFQLRYAYYCLIAFPLFFLFFTFSPAFFILVISILLFETLLLFINLKQETLSSQVKIVLKNILPILFLVIQH